MERFLARVRAGVATGEVRFGSPHFSHAVLKQDGVFRVRELFLSKEKVDAWKATHASFMPEHAERLSEPTGQIVLEAPTLDELIRLLQASSFRL